MKLLCYGDSNTYGFDPRDPFGFGYPSSLRWTSRLAALLGKGTQVVNAGENGRQFPRTQWELQFLDSLLERHAPDRLVVMLGTNDVLTLYFPTAEQVGQRLEALLHHLSEHWPELSVLVVAPPVPNLPGEADLLSAARGLAAEYARVSAPFGVSVVDSASWNIPLAFDGVHFTEEGHKMFAEHLAESLQIKN